MTTSSPFLPYGRHSVDDEDIAAVTAVLRGDWLTTGPAVSAFEEAIAEKTSSSFAVACSNGTTALHLSTWALGLRKGDAAIVPTVSFLATANCVRYTDAEVIFADVDADTGLLTPQSFDQALTVARSKQLTVRAVLPVHLAGQPADMAAISAMAREHRVNIVEDCCHIVGGSYSADEEGKIFPAGSNRYGDMSVFSFHPVKTITAGEGGAITTNDPTLAQKLRLLRAHGITRSPDSFKITEQAFDRQGNVNRWYYEMSELGHNFRLSDINCALGLSQLKKLDRFVQCRQALSDRYDRLLASLSPVVRPLGRMAGQPAWHLYVALIDFDALGIERERFMERLKEKGIGTQVHYLPMHRQPYYRQRYGQISLPGADRYYDRCLSLPLFPEMRDEDVDRVVEAIKAIVS